MRTTNKFHFLCALCLCTIIQTKCVNREVYAKKYIHLKGFMAYVLKQICF